MSTTNVNSFGTFGNFIKTALFLDAPKRYNFGSTNVDEFGIGLSFEKGGVEDDSLQEAGMISTLANIYRNNYPLQVATNAGTHIIVHELGHFAAMYAFTGKCSEIAIIVDQCGGVTYLPRCINKFTGWKRTVISVAGPMADVALCACKLMTASALRSFASSIAPSSLAGSMALLSIAGVLSFGAVLWIAQELTYAFCGAVKPPGKEPGKGDDFQKIAAQGPVHLAAASLALVTECALALIVATR
ncbi:MAG: site-2 protease family protein [Rhabdochlamydiaceae bacterium]|jgi:hypothetical protein